MTKTDAVAPIFCLIALLYVVSGFVGTSAFKPVWPVPVSPVQPAEPFLSGGGFAPDAVPDVEQPKFGRGPLTYYGSFLERGDSTGSVASAQFRALPDFYMFVSGFPNRPGNHLLLEVQTESGAVVRMRISPFDDLARRWLLERVSLRSIPGAKSFRILQRTAIEVRRDG